MRKACFSKNRKHEVSFVQTTVKHTLPRFFIKKASVAIFIVTALLMWQCSKNADLVGPDSGSTQTLKESLATGTQNLSNAVSAISNTYGYKVINLSDAGGVNTAQAYAASAYQDSVTLAKISGLYEYQPITSKNWYTITFAQLFKRTSDNSHLIVKLPKEKVFFPHRLRSVDLADSLLKNNLKIDASDYHYYYSNGLLWDYSLSAGITLNDTAIGNLTVQTSQSTASNYAYNAAYVFPNGYNVAVKVKSGDTASSSIALSGSSGVLLQETVNRYKVTGYKYREREYKLDIGTVELKRNSGSDSITVYVSGVLQTKATVKVVDATGSSGSVFSGRDLKITFDDGTSQTLSALLGHPSQSWITWLQICKALILPQIL